MVSALGSILGVFLGAVMIKAESEGAWTSMLGAVESCLPSSPGLAPCLKSKAVILLDEAIAAERPLAITEYLSLAPEDNEEGRSASPAPVPDSADETELDEALKDRIARLLSTRTLRLTIPGKEIVEGRKKKNKGMGMLMMAAMAMKGMMLQMAMGKIAMLAGKALMIGKMALLLSAIVGLRRLVGSSPPADHPQVVYATEGHHTGHSGWSRQLTEADAQPLAYRAQARISKTGNDI